MPPVRLKRLIHPGPKLDQQQAQALTGQAPGSLLALPCLRQAMRELIPLPSEASLATFKGNRKPDCPGHQEKR